MIQSEWGQLTNLVLVAGHAVYVGEDFLQPEQDRNWLLQSFQRGEPPYYLEHIRAGVDIAASDRSSLLIFSGGQTRAEAGPRSEAQSYWYLAAYFRWWSQLQVLSRASTEEFAKDSFENLLFGLCRFYECTGRFPEKTTVVSWDFKAERFSLHRNAIRFPESRFAFQGVNQPKDVPDAYKGEAKAIADFTKDPYGSGEKLGNKRDERNPFKRTHPYSLSCPQLCTLLQHQGPEPFDGQVPWE